MIDHGKYPSDADQIPNPMSIWQSSLHSNQQEFEL